MTETKIWHMNVIRRFSLTRILRIVIKMLL